MTFGIVIVHFQFYTYALNIMKFVTELAKLGPNWLSWGLKWSKWDLKWTG